MRKFSTQCMDDLEKKVTSQLSNQRFVLKANDGFLETVCEGLSSGTGRMSGALWVCVELRITERESILLGSLSFFVYFCENKKQDYEAFGSTFPAFR